MEARANTLARETSPTLEGLAMQARALRTSINLNMWQLARVFIEAKELVPHGEWGAWLNENAEVGVRTAEDMISAYKRFGQMPQLENLSKTKIFRMLPLPEGTEDSFLEKNDVENMSTREIKEAVKKAREEAQAEIYRERRLREAAEARIGELEAREPEVPEQILMELDELRDAKENADHFAQMAKNESRERLELERRVRELTQEVDEQNSMLTEQQEALDKAQEELLNMQSSNARSDGAREPADEMTAAVFAGAVREFIGTCARMPYMSGAFTAMDSGERSEYDELLRTIEGWCAGARRALECRTFEGGFING